MKSSVLILLLFLGIHAYGQHNLCLELQVYPTGVIPSIGLAKQLGNSSELQFRIGANILDHKDFGVQDSEKGAGLGGSLGYRIFKTSDRNKFYLGLRTDLWKNKIDWSSGTQPIIARGESQILVLQPTAEIGYRFSKFKKQWFIQPAISFGREFNIQTIGAEIGQGWILLAGLSVGI